MSDFDNDLKSALRKVSNARASLVQMVGELSPDDLEGARRGSWTVRRILEHVIESDNLYGMAVAAIRGQSPRPATDAAVSGLSPAEIAGRVDACGAALTAAVDGVSEDDFYRIQRLGRDEYSILSILENAGHHYKEHAQQIEQTLTT